MSDPVTNVDIEDVLSSIRRLVTEETRDETRKPSRGGDAASRLLLTPSLRVVDRVPDEPASQNEVQPEESFSQLSDVEESDPVEATAQAETDATPNDHAAEPTMSERIQADPLVLSDTIESGTEEIDFAAHEGRHQGSEQEAAAESFVFSSRYAELRSRSDTLKAKIKALEAAIAETPGPWEPDGSGVDEDVFPVAEALPWRDDVAKREKSASVNAAAETVSGPAPEEALAAEIEPAQTGPEDVGQAIEAETTEPDESILDEATLRQMVAEIVREELQGVLGERITRNVRKLVRQEIQRALAAQDLG